MDRGIGSITNKGKYWMKSLSGLGLLGNNKGVVQPWWMPRWCVYVRIIRANKIARTYILKNIAVKPIYDLPVIIRNDEVVGAHLGKKI